MTQDSNLLGKFFSAEALHGDFVSGEKWKNKLPFRDVR